MAPNTNILFIKSTNGMSRNRIRNHRASYGAQHAENLQEVSLRSDNVTLKLFTFCNKTTNTWPSRLRSSSTHASLYAAGWKQRINVTSSHKWLAGSSELYRSPWNACIAQLEEIQLTTDSFALLDRTPKVCPYFPFLVLIEQSKGRPCLPVYSGTIYRRIHNRGCSGEKNGEKRRKWVSCLASGQRTLYK